MNNLLIFYLLRRYWWIYLLCLSIGFGYVAFSRQSKAPQWLWKGQLYCKAEYYDPVMQLTRPWNSAGQGGSKVPAEVLPPSAQLRVDAYRNEDIYVFDIQASVDDSLQLRPFISWVQSSIAADSLIYHRYYLRRDEMQKAIDNGMAMDSASIKSAMDELQRAFMLNMLRTQLNDLNLRFSVKLPPAGAAVQVQADQQRPFLVALVSACFLALAASFFLYQRSIRQNK